MSGQEFQFTENCYLCSANAWKKTIQHECNPARLKKTEQILQYHEP